MNSKDALTEYLHEAKILELTEKLEKQGYNLLHDFRAGDHQFDIVATKPNGEKLFIEVKSGKMPQENIQRISQMAHYVKHLDNARFELVVASPPRKKEIELIGLEESIFSCIVNDFPSELDELSTHTRLDEVTDVDIDSITIQNGTIHITGTATVGVSLQMDSDRNSEEDEDLYDSFPLKFDLVLDHEMNIQTVNDLEIDTSSFYR